MFHTPQLSVKIPCDVSQLANQSKALRSNGALVIASVKYDGVRVEINKDGAFSRNGERIQNREIQGLADEIFAQLTRNEPEILQLSTEYVAADCTFKSSVSQAKGLYAAADGNFHIFDCIVAAPYMHYGARLMKLPIEAANRRAFLVAHQLLAACDTVSLEGFYTSTLLAGAEGIVVANAHAKHKAGRSTLAVAESVKVKPTKSTQGYVSSYMLKDEYVGSGDLKHFDAGNIRPSTRVTKTSTTEVGTLEVMTSLGRVQVFSGITQEARMRLYQYLHVNKKPCVDLRAVIVYDCLTPTGSLRFPRVSSLVCVKSGEVFVG